MASYQNQGLVRQLTGKLLQAYNDNVAAEEVVHVRLQPYGGQALVVTDRRVIIIKAGLATGGGLFGASVKSFQFANITSVDLRIGLTGGHLQLTAAGSVEVRDKGFMDMAQSENAVTFAGEYKEIMKAVAGMIRQRADATRSRHSAASQSGAGQPDLADQITRLA